MNSDVNQGVRYDAAHARAYERKIRALIPGYETLHELSAFLLAEQLPSDARILVAGSGTGEELHRYATMMPQWQLTGVEPSPDMNALASRKIADAGLHAQVGLIEGKPGEVALDGPFDAATSLLVMHFLPDDGSKQRYLSALAEAVKPGGVLLLADLCGSHGDAAFDLLFSTWRRQQDATRGKPEAVELDFAHLKQNVHPLSAVRRADLLNEVGFEIAGEYWRALGLSAVAAIRR